MPSVNGTGSFPTAIAWSSYNRLGPVPSNLSLRDLLTGARKRELVQLFQHRAAQALMVAMAGVILLLLLGTQILDWYWVALVALVSLGVGIYRIRREIPSLYILAQRIDKKLRLADTLSTAFFFTDNPDRSREAICQLQQHRAESTARDVDLRAAMPFHRSRFLMPAAGLALVALGLFAVRYMVTGSMDLQPNLVSVAMDNFFGTKSELAKNLKPDKKSKFDQKDVNSPDNPTTENEQQPEDLLSGTDSQDPTQGPDNSKQTADAPPDKKEKPDDTKDGDEQPDGKDSSSDGKQGNDPKDKSGDSNSKDSKQGTQSQSMMDKLKDAVQNLMDSMKSSEDSQNSQNQNKGKQQQKSSDQQKGQKGDQSKSDSESAGADQQNQDGAQQQSDAKSAQKSADKSSQQDAKNGAGSQDGDKLRRQAEELQAMGKISQILGQRSANITGEVTVEVGNTKQQLKTPWASSQAVHHDVGGEVPRDEVPLIYQEFVRQYFEEIHKPAPQVGKPIQAKPGPQKGSGPSKASPTP
jgi:hypothetical protein